MDVRRVVDRCCEEEVLLEFVEFSERKICLLECDLGQGKVKGKRKGKETCLESISCQ